MNKILMQQHGWGSQWLSQAKNMHREIVCSEWFYFDKILENRKWSVVIESRPVIAWADGAGHWEA